MLSLYWCQNKTVLCQDWHTFDSIVYPIESSFRKALYPQCVTDFQSYGRPQVEKLRLSKLCCRDIEIFSMLTNAMSVKSQLTITFAKKYIFCILNYSCVHNSPLFGLFMKQNAYVPVGGNEEGGRATPTSISIFDYYVMKTL